MLAERAIEMQKDVYVGTGTSVFFC